MQKRKKKEERKKDRKKERNKERTNTKSPNQKKIRKDKTSDLLLFNVFDYFRPKVQKSDPANSAAKSQEHNTHC